jgi:large subunit ribosomal protein L3
MVRISKPVSGSRAYWPKKRADRIYQDFRSFVETKDISPLVFAGYKAGMTQVSFVDTTKGAPTEGMEIVKTVTVLDCPPLYVAGVKAYKKAGYGIQDAGLVWAEKLSKDLRRKTTVPKNPKPDFGRIEKQMENIVDIRLLVHTKPRESGGMDKKKPELFEVDLGGRDVKAKLEFAKQKLGQEIRVSEIFKTGEMVDVKAVTKGKGYQGPVKRFGVKVRTRKATKKRRHVGCLGPRSVARVKPKVIAMAGQLGFQTRTEYNKKILKVGSGDDTNPRGGFVHYGLVKGDFVIVCVSVPVPRTRLIMLRKALRSSAQPGHVEIKHISRETQQ